MHGKPQKTSQRQAIMSSQDTLKIIGPQNKQLPAIIFFHYQSKYNSYNFISSSIINYHLLQLINLNLSLFKYILQLPYSIARIQNINLHIHTMCTTRVSSFTWKPHLSNCYPYYFVAIHKTFIQHIWAVLYIPYLLKTKKNQRWSRHSNQLTCRLKQQLLHKHSYCT